MSNLETVTNLLLLLKKEELESVIKTATAMVGKSSSMGNGADDAELFYKILNKSYNNTYPSLKALEKTAPKVHLRIVNTSIFLKEYLDTIFKRHNMLRGTELIVTKNHKLVMYSLFVDVMAAWFLKLEIPNSLKSTVTHHLKFPSILERQFPGYMRAGMLVPFVFESNRYRSAST